MDPPAPAGVAEASPPQKEGGLPAAQAARSAPGGGKDKKEKEKDKDKEKDKIPVAAQCAGVWAFLERGAAEVAAAAAAAAAAEPGVPRDANPSLLAASVSGNAPEHCVSEWDKSKFHFTVDNMQLAVKGLDRSRATQLAYTLDGIGAIKREKTMPKRAVVYAYAGMGAQGAALSVELATRESVARGAACQELWRLEQVPSSHDESVRRFVALAARYGSLALDDAAAWLCGPAPSGGQGGTKKAACDKRRKAAKRLRRDVASTLIALGLLREEAGTGGGNTRALTERYRWCGAARVGEGLVAAWAKMEAAGVYMELDELVAEVDANAPPLPPLERPAHARRQSEAGALLAAVAARLQALPPHERAMGEALAERAERALEALPPLAERRAHYERAAKRARTEGDRLLDKLLVYEGKAA